MRLQGLNPGQFAAIHALLLYNYNVDPSTQIKALFSEDIHPEYLDEKLKEYGKGLASFMGSLDRRRQVRYARHAWELYGQEASEMALAFFE